METIPQGRPAKYLTKDLAIGETISFHAETKPDTVRIHKHVHQAAERKGIYVRGKMDRETRIITFTRVR